MKLYNTFSEKKESLDLSQKIGIYVCGITPYDTTHLGHAFTFVVYDSLIRYLRFMGSSVTYVQNVTDIDDDILIRVAALGKSWKKLGQEETLKHTRNMDALHALRPDFYPKATENIVNMIAIIKKLVDKKLAYVKNGEALGPQSKGRGPHGSVYFDIAKDKNFGKLSKFGYRAMLEIANDRGNNPLDLNKKDPLDFVLWQARRENEPFWKSPWGDGRPGWHIECSAMSMRYLDTPITIHGGGTDLIFPHHEAEIAQSENATGKKFVKLWMHTAIVYCGSKKMSKSLGNMVFVSDLLNKYDFATIRILLLSHHYRSAWNFDEKELKISQKVAQLIKKSAKDGNLSPKELKKIIPGFFEALDDDFNTPKAINILANLAKSQKNPKAVFAASHFLGL